MALASTRRTGLVDQVIEQLRNSVVTGSWPVGTRIPIEPELAEALGVGRNTVREAVRALAHAGLLEVRQGDGTYVRATSEVSGALRRLRDSELREVLQVRRALEVEGARLAAAARTDDDLARLRTLLEHRAQARTSERADAFAHSDSEFHLAVVTASHNSVLIEMYRGLTDAVRASIASTDAPQDDAEANAHAGVVDALEAEDADAAAHAAGQFLNELLGRVQRT